MYDKWESSAMYIYLHSVESSTTNNQPCRELNYKHAPCKELNYVTSHPTEYSATLQAILQFNY